MLNSTEQHIFKIKNTKNSTLFFLQTFLKLDSENKYTSKIILS